MTISYAKREILKKAFAEIINRNSIENDSNTPDFILAEYLVNCLENFGATVIHRDDWYDTSQSEINAIRPKD